MNAPQNSTTLAALQAPKREGLPAIKAGFFDLESFELIQRVSKAFAQSDLVPNAYRGNLPNCMIAIDMAQRIGANPLMVMQNLYIVHGTPGWSSKFLIATVNTCGRYSAMRYEWKGTPSNKDFGCRAWAIERETGEKLFGVWVTWEMVRAEGWDTKNGSKWKTMPDQMFVYRAAAFWTRAYAPELSMGLQTAEELGDVIDMEQGSDGRYVMSTDDFNPSKEEKNTNESQGSIENEPQPTAQFNAGGLTDEEKAAIEAEEKAEAAAQAQQQADPTGETRQRRRASSGQQSMSME